MAKKNPCEFCEDDQQWKEEGTKSQLFVEFYPMNGLIGVTSFAEGIHEETEEITIGLNIDYCPFCGRKLETF